MQLWFAQFSFLFMHLHRNPFLRLHSSSISISLFLSPSRKLLTRSSFVSLSTKCPNLSLISEFFFLSMFFPNFHLHLCFASSYNLCFFSDRFSWSACFRRSVFFFLPLYSLVFIYQLFLLSFYFHYKAIFWNKLCFFKTFKEYFTNIIIILKKKKFNC